MALGVMHITPGCIRISSRVSDDYNNFMPGKRISQLAIVLQIHKADRMPEGTTLPEHVPITEKDFKRHLTTIFGKLSKGVIGHEHGTETGFCHY